MYVFCQKAKQFYHEPWNNWASIILAASNGQVAATPSLKLQGKSGAGGMEKCWPLMTPAIILHDTMVRRQGDGEWSDFCGR